MHRLRPALVHSFWNPLSDSDVVPLTESRINPYIERGQDIRESFMEHSAGRSHSTWRQVLRAETRLSLMKWPCSSPLPLPTAFHDRFSSRQHNNVRYKQQRCCWHHFHGDNPLSGRISKVTKPSDTPRGGWCLSVGRCILCRDRRRTPAGGDCCCFVLFFPFSLCVNTGAASHRVLEGRAWNPDKNI